MSYHRADNLVTAIKQHFGPRQVKGQLNPTHLTIATQSYRIQSDILHIPDRFGFFSPGPLRLQAHQGAEFGILFFLLGVICILGIGIIVWFRARGDPVFILASAMMLVIVGVAISIWIMSWYDRRRSKDYDWGNEDGKLRKE